VALLGGLYAADVTASLRHGLGWTAAASLVALPLAHGLRSTALFGGGTQLSFVLVSGVFGGAFLFGWRALAVYILD
jgi:hypothetical protein